MRSTILLPMALLALTSALVLGGCSGRDVDENDPKSLFADAEENIKSDQYQLAIDKFRMIKNKFPYSGLAVDAQLRIADVYFLQESFAEAAAAYEAFRDLHPKHAKVPYAMFRTAQSHQKDMPSTIQRDLTSGFRAQDAYNEFLVKFPNAPEAAEAREELKRVRDQLAEKEFAIAGFYLKREFWDAATKRYQKLRALYPETTWAEKAQERLARAARKQSEAQEKEAEEAARE